MRKLPFYMAFWVLGLFPMLVNAQAPVRAFPYDQGFGANFNPEASAFLPGWWWNKEGEGQLFQFDWQGRSDMTSLAMLPVGTSRINALVFLDLKGKKNTYLGFWVATLKNGGAKDLQRTHLSVSISTNGGRDFGFEIPIGPAGGFENQTTTFQYFQYPFPSVTDGKPSVALRFAAWTDGGQQEPTILLLDDIRIAQAPTDVSPPFIVSLE